MLPRRSATGHVPGRRRGREPRVRRPAGRLEPEPLAEGGFVYRRRSIWLAAGLAALLLVPAALAVGVHVRVEGKTRNIYGSTEPTLTVNANALDALDSASLAGEFYYHLTTTSFGPYVDQIGRYVA